ncbi:glycoside hydrolase family 88 protein [Butyrivibrio sp. YAB3001]|uniref:glycoside hydrolase family 88 protein n=1 Tax=Butyrivibrio sp. YAB3001 TaxID=1520812 RepID=UPI0008F65C33|nr:glycoside hydrolase family 88 protein [Butyrivibrio sp. YAB3001]SFC77297.1 Rhamnogalacturonyl hydrolase YesR [Butyrivibrio sp. YAB3001]
MDRVEPIVLETIHELNEIMNVSPKEALKDMVKKAMGRSVRTKDPLFWPAGMLMLGITQYMEQHSEEKGELYNECYKALSEHALLWKNKYGGKIEHVDDALAGACFIKGFELEKDEKFLSYVRMIDSYLMQARTDVCGSVIYNPGRNSSNIFSDGIGQVTMFMASFLNLALGNADRQQGTSMSYGLPKPQEKEFTQRLEKLRVQLSNFYKYGRDEKTGLIYHGYSLHKNTNADGMEGLMECERKGLLGWGRACGWLMMGLSECALLEKELEMRKISCGKAAIDIMAWYFEMCEVMMDYQRKDGGWSWQIQAVDGHIDLSATGMIAYSLKHGLSEGIFDDKSEMKEKVILSIESAEKCILANTKEGIVQNALSSCDDFGVHYQTYGSFPWGQGATLAALS